MTLRGRGEESEAMIQDRQEDVAEPASTASGSIGLTRVRIRWSAVRASRRIQLARYWRTRGQLDEAAGHAYRATRVLDGCPPAVLAADVAYTTAQIEFGRARYPHSMAQFERAAAILNVLPPGRDRDRRLADVHIGLADVHRRSGRYVEAAAALGAARRLVHRHDTAIVMLLGVIAKEQARFCEAARHYARLEQARLNHSDTATLYRNLADLANAEFRYDDAERLAQRAVLLRRADPRATAADVAQDVAILAAAVAGQHRYDEARHLFGQALAAGRAAQPTRHDEVAANLHSLAGIEHDCGKLPAAEGLYREALAIKHRLLGPAHPEVALIMDNMAILLRDLGRKDEAANYFRQALAITEARGSSFPARLTLAVP
jgi:tetratricopeptide (TPR) repeat protein